MKLTNRQIEVIADQIHDQLEKQIESAKKEFLTKVDKETKLSDKEKAIALKDALKQKKRSLGYTFNKSLPNTNTIANKIVLATIGNDDLTSLLSGLGKELGFDPKKIK